MTERRGFLRFETALSALCDIVSKKCRAYYKILNISKEGAMLVVDKELKEGDEINISMDVPGDNMPIFAAGRVAWQKEPFKANQYETGIRFTKIDSLDRGRLLEYIYSQWLKLLDKE